jgi:transmembrane sensor
MCATALGTEFTLRRFLADQVELLVTDGTVLFSRTRSIGGADRIVVQAGQLAVDRAGVITLKKLAASDATLRQSWRSDLISFDNVTVAEAVAEMNRYSTVQLVISDPRIASIRVSGIVPVHRVDTFVAMLESLNIRGTRVSSWTSADEIQLQPSK